MAEISEASASGGIGAGQAQVFNTMPTVQNFTDWAGKYYADKKLQEAEQRKLQQEKDKKAEEDKETILTYTPDAFLPYQDEAITRSKNLITELQGRLAKGEKFEVGSQFYYDMKKKQNEVAGFVAKTKDVEKTIEKIREEVKVMSGDEYDKPAILSQLNNFLGKKLQDVTAEDIRSIAGITSSPAFVNIDGKAKKFVKNLESITQKISTIKQKGYKSWTETREVTMPPYIKSRPVTVYGIDGSSQTILEYDLSSGRLEFNPDDPSLINDIKSSEPELFDALTFQAEKRQAAGDQREYGVIFRELAEDAIRKAMKVKSEVTESNLQDRTLEAQRMAQEQQRWNKEFALKEQQQQAKNPFSQGAGDKKTTTALTDVGRVISGDAEVFKNTEVVSVNGQRRTLASGNGKDLLGGGMLGPDKDSDQIDKVFYDPDTKEIFYNTKDDQKLVPFNFSTVKTLINSNEKDANMRQQLINEMTQRLISEGTESFKKDQVFGTPITGIGEPQRFKSAVESMREDITKEFKPDSNDRKSPSEAPEKAAKIVNNVLQKFDNLDFGGKRELRVKINNSFMSGWRNNFDLVGKDANGKEVIIESNMNDQELADYLSNLEAKNPTTETAPETKTATTPETKTATTTATTPQSGKKSKTPTFQ